MRGRAWLALALVPLLSGCLAAVAVPLVAGGSLFARDRLRVQAATQVPEASLRERKGAARARGPEAPSPGLADTSLKALPPPDAPLAGGADDPWQAFFSYALAQATAADDEKDKIQSALLASPPVLDAPVRRDCPSPHPAVVVDLDDGPAAFQPDRPISPPPALVQGLAKLRAANVVVLWISRLPAARVADVARALRGSGLDPRGQDQLLLVRNADDRKQLLRQDANRDVCVVAIAGDQKADFDELFDYLRNPDAAVGLSSMMRHGWFLVPALGAPAPAAQ